MNTYCTSCRTRPRSIAVHLTTVQHRRATRPKATRPWNARTGRPSWAIALDGDPYAVSEAEEAAAAARLGLDYWGPDRATYEDELTAFATGRSDGPYGSTSSLMGRESTD